MIWAITFIEPENYIRVSTQGDFTLEDCKKIKEDFIAREFWSPGKNILYDYRETNFDSPLTLNALRKLGEFHESKNAEIGDGRMAFLMKSPRDFGLARQYEMLTEGRVLSKICVFMHEDKALEWLTSETIIH